MSAAVPISTPGSALVRRRIGWTVAAAVALLAAVVLSLAIGARPVAPGQVLDALLHDGRSKDALVVREMRLPRTLVGLMVGAALALAGTVLQGLTRNPIGDPGILGISQGASLGVVSAIMLAGVESLTGFVWWAFAGAALASVAVYAVASRGRGGASPVKLALAGAAINALIVAVVHAVLATHAAVLDRFRFWQVGSLAGGEPVLVSQMWPFLLVGAVMVASVARGLDALALGEDVAKGLGQNVAAVRIVGGLGATVLTGIGVAAAGPIAFLGLAVPHIARALVGGDHRWLLPMAALLGPVVLLLADTAGRVIFPPGEVPSGVMTALIGVPFLIALVRRRKAVAA
ncbi:iron ABC transporter permease [Streptomyces eurocidicus]|uniref:Iron ABC transporter permease n=1 Tax=Streptomyces eurocidicus TaxID=66423 RepID=A0A2N8NPT1_STREU|nr:iron ABC transporter permease [Streptomyces eurocidicus]MBB5119454.1 iron complex transport system permease protein [Streptomyces eurocidicus]MBF6054031.1 iron chelate uptake ABC transporter family permease subunit [Streptomyces eurocidicus]PNE30782.1 iron ABC transporter permease [Streptomyces eurocidicus]